MGNVIERLEALAALDWEAADADEYAIRAALPDLLKLARLVALDHIMEHIGPDDPPDHVADAEGCAFCAALEPLFREDRADA